MINPSTPHRVFAGVDWGTSSFRLWLFGDDGEVIAERKSGEGMVAADRFGFPTILQSHLAAVAAPDDCPVVMCGMVGARQGWVEAGYVDVPVSLTSAFDHVVAVPDQGRRIAIVPGLAQRSEDCPEVMRGEETLLLGVLQETWPAPPSMICMPGTHSKWVQLSGDTVTGFSTYMTGEFFSIASKHSVIAHSLPERPDFDRNNAAFEMAVRDAYASPARIMNAIFKTRAAHLIHNLSRTDAAAHLSGSLIGAEIAAAACEGEAKSPICLVSSGRLRDLYESAFLSLSLPHVVFDADEMAKRGLAAIARRIFV